MWDHLEGGNTRLSSLSLTGAQIKSWHGSFKKEGGMKTFVEKRSALSALHREIMIAAVFLCHFSSAIRQNVTLVLPSEILSRNVKFYFTFLF